MLTLPGFLKNIPQIELDESKKKILIVYALGILIVVALYIFVFLQPTLGNLCRVVPKLRKRSAEIKTVTDDLTFQEKLKNRLSELDKKFTKYEKKLSREKELPLLLENFSKTARASHVKILSITPLSMSRKKKSSLDATNSVYQEVPIVITARSGYHELGTFINKLENNERFLQVTDVKIRANAKNPKRHDIEFIVYAYTMQGEAENGK